MHNYSAISGHAPRPVLNAIKTASAKTGVDFDYMVKQAAAESSFNPRAKAKTSSARGLYQFINSTWLDVVKRHGAKHGINPNQSHSRLLALRDDAKASSLMAAEFAADNKRILEQRWGGKVGATEQYFAHFMGAGGASAFLNARDENPLQKAAYLFPKEARANKSIFYDRATGRAKTLDEVYAHFDKKFNTNKAEKSVVFKNDNVQKSILKNNANQYETITWNQYPTESRTASYNPIPNRSYVFNPLDILLLQSS